jgi:hypothetical protein
LRVAIEELEHEFFEVSDYDLYISFPVLGISKDIKRKGNKNQIRRRIQSSKILRLRYGIPLVRMEICIYM